MLTGSCTEVVFFCPYCEKIWGGIAQGNVWKRCDWCGIQCEREDVPIEKRMCGSEECIRRSIFGNLRLKTK